MIWNRIKIGEFKNTFHSIFKIFFEFLAKEKIVAIEWSIYIFSSLIFGKL